nr:immunoglobulin heavy chain junction region [Mus musculus]
CAREGHDGSSYYYVMDYW